MYIPIFISIDEYFSMIYSVLPCDITFRRNTLVANIFVGIVDNVTQRKVI